VTEVPLTQPVPVDGRNDPPEEAPEVSGKGLEFLIEGIPQDVMIEVPDEVDQALLLRTR
jgi:hypothetical protein